MPDIQAQIAEAVRLLRKEIRWKPNSAARHLYKRKRHGHLTQEATLDEYERLIRTVVADTSAQVYLFWYNRIPYVSVVALVNNQKWLVMFGLDGLMETAFIIDIPNYLEQPGFENIGGLDEVMTHES